MSKNKLFFLFLIPFLVVATLTYFRFRTPEDTWVCEQGVWVKHGNPSFPMPAKPCQSEGEIITAENAEKINGLPNPAAQNCLDKGGELGYLQETAGTLGICKFDDGSECEEWQFFREECQKGQYQKADTTHPYHGFISKSGQNYTFKTESGVEYSLSLTKEENQGLKERLLAESNSGQAITILASETPPLSKTLVLKGFQGK